MKRKYIAFGPCTRYCNCCFGSQGVQNPAVKARMDGMSAIAENMKTLGQMAKGATEFDAAMARAAAATIAEQASATPGLFESQ